MKIGPKYKICKRLGASVFEKCQTQKFQLAESTRAPRKGGRRGGSAYGLQLLEKQKARFTYGLSETQFARYVHEAMEKRGVSAMTGLVARLESRLDNTVFRIGLVKTRRAARQLVSHGHIMVNGKRMNVPSYMVKAGDRVGVREGSKQSPLFANRAEAMLEHKAPTWLKVGEDGLSAEVTAEPVIAESELAWSPATIVQFYSR
jgi:small subunit ribosomal protein S4